MNKLSLSILTSSLIFSSSLLAEVEMPEKHVSKRTLAGNMNITYKVLPSEVDSFSEMFEKGIFYGRLRFHAFNWDWSEETAQNKDNHALGIGGSIVYKTGKFNGLSATAGLYTSQSPFYRMDNDEVGYVKAGKDTFSRNKVKSGEDWGITILGESYLQYDLAKTSIRAGRQMFHSVFTKSNDTKMIPNTFDGISVESKGDIKNTNLQFAYFNAQKLRDHTHSHDVITFKDSDGNKWNNNDDSAIHKGLTYDNFKANGDDVSHSLMIGTAETKFAGLQVVGSYLTVPDVVSQGVLEAHYKIKAGDWSIAPGFRYMMQMDDGGGEVGGASLTGALANWKSGEDKLGYSDPKSLDGSLMAGRVVVQDKKKTTKILAGYSQISDDADIVAPWRGFPTGGYTRAMAQYNWVANTSSWMIQGVYDFGKAGMVDGFKVSARYAVMDFDDEKAKASADRDIIHVDMWKKFKSLPDFEFKFRTGIVSSDSGGEYNKADTSYNEYRVEMNYLF
jgi:hypothetical protein